MITLKQLPTSVKLFVERCDAFIVGSAANPNAQIQDDSESAAATAHIFPDNYVNDIDVVIPFHKWDIACIIIKTALNSTPPVPVTYQEPKLNAYGGLRFVDDSTTIDVWPSDLNKYLLSSLVEYVWNPKFNLRYVRCATGDTQ